MEGNLWCVEKPRKMYYKIIDQELTEELKNQGWTSVKEGDYQLSDDEEFIDWVYVTSEDFNENYVVIEEK